MLDPAVPTGAIGAAVLLVISFVALLAGTALRKWPEKVQALTADLDGFALFLSPEAHRAHITLSGGMLLVMSFVALFAAALVL